MKHLCLAAAAACLTAGLASAQSQSASFSNNTDAYFEVLDHPALTPAGGITVEAWVTYDETTLGTGWRYPTIVRKNGDAGQESYFLRVEAGSTAATNLRWLVNTADQGFRDVNVSFPPGGLLGGAHVAGTYDGTELRLYVNGALQGSTAATGAIVDNGKSLTIGKGSHVSTPIEVWNGAIDEVRIWPFARTQAELQASMNQEIHGLPGGVLSWSLDGTTMASAGGLDAVANGTFQWTPAAGGLTSTHFFAGAPFGASTAGCQGPIGLGVSSLPQTGNGAFALVGQAFDPGASVLCYLGTSSLAAPLSVLGIDVWVDPVGALGLFPATVDALGTARLDLPVVAALPAGIVATAQFIGFDVCGPQGITASSGMGVVTLP